MFFEDFTIDQLVVSRGRTVTETDIVQFAGLTGDFSEAHTNEEWARQSAFGRRLAHGALIFSISIGLTVRSGLVEDSLIAFYTVEGLRFTQPVFIGDTVLVHKRVQALDKKGPGRGLVTFYTKVVNQREAVVLRYRDSLLVKSRDPRV